MAKKFVLTGEVQLRLSRSAAQQVGAQIRQTLKGINVGVGVNIPRNTNRNIQRVHQNLNKVSKSADSAAKKTENFGEAIAYAGKRFLAFTIATSAMFKLVGALKQGVGEAIRFERELVKIAQVNKVSLSSLTGLTDEITRLGTELGTSSTKLVESSRVLAQTGLAAKDVKIALDALAKSELAPTFSDISKTTEGAIAIFRQFKVSASELESVLGSINTVSGQFAVESDDIITAVRRTGGAFAAAGGSLNELIALFTSVRSTTRETAESIATGFRTIFTRLQRVSTQNFLKSLGIDLRNLQGQFVGPYKAIAILNRELEKLDSTDPRFAQIIEELGGFRQVSKVIPLVQQFATAERALGVATYGTTSLTEDAAKAQQTLAVQIAKTREEFVAMLRRMSNSTAFRGLITLSLNLAKALVKVADALKPILPFIGLTGAAFLGKQTLNAIPGVRKVFGFETGGMVPGYGNKDTVPVNLDPGQYVLRKQAVQALGITGQRAMSGGGSVPAMVTPGEYIVDKKTVNKIGVPTLDMLNKADKFATGGITRFKPIFQPRSIAPGNVGKQKQYLLQRKEFLQKGALQNILTPRERQELAEIKRKLSQIERSRNKRFPTFLDKMSTNPSLLSPGARKYFNVNRGGAIKRFAHGGLVGGVNKFATGGPVRMAGGGVLGGVLGGGLGDVAGVSIILSTLAGAVASMDSLGESTKETVNKIIQFGTQAGVLFFVMRNLGDLFGRYSSTVNRLRLTNEGLINTNKNLKRTGVQYRQDVTNLNNKVGAGQQLTPAEVRERNIKSNFLATERDRRIENVKKAKANRAEIGLARQREARLQGVALAAAAASGAMITLGSAMQDSAKKIIEAGKGIEGQLKFAAGQAVSQAGSFAAGGQIAGGVVGSVFGPGGTLVGAGIGGGIGAAAGAVYGFATGKEEAKAIANLRDFGISLEEVTRQLESLSENKTELPQVSSNVRQFTENVTKQLRSTQTPAQDIIEKTKTQVNSLGKFLDESAKSAKTFDEFLNIAGKDTVSLFSRLTNIPISELNKKFRDNIQESVKLTASNERAIKVQDLYTERMRQIIGTTKAFNDAVEVLSQSASRFDQLIGLAEGKYTSPIIPQSNRLGSVDKFFDAGEFTRILNRDIRNNPLFSGDFGRTAAIGLADEAQSISEVIRQLPSSLLQLRSSPEALSGERIVDRLLNSFGDIPRNIRNAIEIQARKIVGEGGKEEKLIEAISQDFVGTIENLQSGLKGTLDAVAQISSQMTDEANRFAKVLSQRAQLDQLALAQQQKEVDLLDQREQALAGLQYRDTNFGALQQLDLQRQSNILGGRAQVNNVQSIIQNLNLASENIRRNQARLETTNDITERQALTSAIDEQQTTVERLTQALDFLADVTKRTAATEGQLDQARKRQDTKYNIAERFTFTSGLSDLGSLSNSILGGQILSQTADITKIPAQFRQEILQFLKGIEAPIGFLGGKSGTQVVQDTIQRTLQSFGIRQDVAAGIAKNAATPEIQKLGQAVEQAYVRAFQATQGREQQIIEQQNNITVELIRSLDDFRKVIAEGLLTERQRQLTTDYTRQSEIANNLQRGIQGRQSIENLLGIKTTADNAKEVQSYLNGVRANLGDIQKVGKQLDFRTAFQSLDVLSGNRFKGLTFSDAPNARQVQNPVSYLAAVEARKFDQIQGLRLTNDVYDVGDLRGNISLKQAEEGIRGIAAKYTKIAPELGEEFLQAFYTALDDVGTENIDATQFGEAIRQGLEAVKSQAIKSYANVETNLAQLQADLSTDNLKFTIDSIRAISKNFDEFSKSIQSFTNDDTYALLNQKYNQANSELVGIVRNLSIIRQQLAGINSPAGRQVGGPVRMANGGVVPGRGNRDTVHALLTPGEVVIPKMANGGQVLLPYNSGVSDEELRKRIQKAAEREENLRKKAEKRSVYKPRSVQDIYAKSLAKFDKDDDDRRMQEILKNVSKRAPDTRSGLQKAFDNIGFGINAATAPIRAVGSEIVAPGIGEFDKELDKRGFTKSAKAVRGTGYVIGNVFGATTKGLKTAGGLSATITSDILDKGFGVQSAKGQGNKFGTYTLSTITDTLGHLSNLIPGANFGTQGETQRQLLSGEPGTIGSSMSSGDRRALAGLDIGADIGIGLALGAVQKPNIFSNIKLPKRPKRPVKLGNTDTSFYTRRTASFADDSELVRQYNLNYKPTRTAQQEAARKLALQKLRKVNKKPPKTAPSRTKAERAAYLRLKNSYKKAYRATLDDEIGNAVISNIILDDPIKNVRSIKPQGRKVLTDTLGISRKRAEAAGYNNIDFQRTDLGPNTAGAYRGKAPGRPSRIRIDKTRGVRTTTKHEVAHWWDYVMGGRNAFRKSATSGVGDTFWLKSHGSRLSDKLFSAKNLDASPQLKALYKEYKFKLIQRYGFDPEYVAYRLKPTEILASMLSNAEKDGHIVKILKAEFAKFGFQKGSYIHGFGSGDKVPAMLEPGEFVLNRNAVSSIGLDKLEYLNNKVSRFQSGGSVRKQQGGIIAPQSVALDMESISALHNVFNLFSNNISKFETIANNFPREITMIGNHNVNVVVNGSQVLQQLTPTIESMITSEIHKAISQTFKTYFPELGPPDVLQRS
jgi:TP901 family phage tail tape measure protein